MSGDNGVPPRGRVDLVLVAALFVLAVATYPLAMLVVDSGRDLGWAHAIAQGQAYPLYGPGLNNLWKLGPVWFYLLAAIVAAGQSITLATLGVGLIAAAKIPLAFALGREWGGPALGLGFAAAIALPGWSTFGQLVFLHTAVVEAAVVATLLLALLGWQRARAAYALGGALLLGLAVHAHPTALVAAPAVALALWRVALARRRWVVLAAAPLAFALPFAPMLVGEAGAGWPQFDATTGYFGASDYAARLARAPALLRGASLGQIEIVRAFLLARWPWLASLVALATLALYLLAATGWLRAAWREARARALAGFAAFAWLFVLLLRDNTPEWMTYACAPFGAALLACGWNALWPEARASHAARGLAAFSLLVSAALLGERVLVARSGVQALPGAALEDIAVPPTHDAALRFWLPAWGHDALARRLCRERDGVALHGDLASAFHFGQGVAAALHCGPDHRIQVGGHAPTQIAGVPRDVATMLQLRGEATTWGFILLAPVSTLMPTGGERVVAHTRYLLDDYVPRLGRDAPRRIRLDAACDARDVLVVTNLLPLLNAPFELHADGGALPPLLAETIASRYFGCPASGAFALELVTLEPRAADAFVLRRQ